MDMTPNEQFAAVLAQDTAARGEALAAQPAPFAPELLQILDTLQPLDFRSLLNCKPNEKVSQKDTLVVVLRELLNSVEAAGAGLAVLNEQPYTYNGRYWQLGNKKQIRAFLAKAAAALGIDETTASYFETRDKLYKQFQDEAPLLAPSRKPGTILVNFPNGTLEILQAGRWKLRPHRRADFLTYELPYCYDPQATSCPLFTAYLNKVQPDPSAQAVLAEFVGNTLAPELNLQKALVLNGPGSNGKSVFCSIVRALLGRDMTTNISMTALTREKFTLAGLDGKLLNVCDEGPAKMDSEIFKTIVAGEPIKVERKHQDPYIMEHYARIMFNCNQLPQDIEQSEGFFRRFLLIPFSVKIEESERDPQLAAKIIAQELPAVFNWVLAGLRRLIRANAFTDCAAARQALEAYRRESNSVLAFIDEYELQPGTGQADRWPLQQVYARYRYYCTSCGRFAFNDKHFNREMKAQGYPSGRDSRTSNWLAVKGFEDDPL